MIKIYSTPTCYWCKKVKEYFQLLNIAFEDIDITNNDDAFEEMVIKSNQMGVPVLDIDGTIIIGFNKAAIDLAINK